jgi:hypothetical protein
LNLINAAKIPSNRCLEFEGKIPELKLYSRRYSSLSELEKTLKEVKILPDMFVRMTQQENGCSSDDLHIVYHTELAPESKRNSELEEYSLAYRVGEDYYLSAVGSLWLL